MDMRRKLMLQVYHMSSIIIQDHLLQKGDVMETVCISTHQPVTRQCIVEHMLITPQLLVIPIGFMKEAVAIASKKRPVPLSQKLFISLGRKSLLSNLLLLW